MAIPEIIEEIDAYLLRLRRAKELLLDRTPEASQKKAPRPKRAAHSGPADRASSRRNGAAKNKSRSDDHAAHLSAVEGVGVDARVAGSLTRDASPSEGPAAVQPEVAPPLSVVIKKLPSK